MVGVWRLFAALSVALAAVGALAWCVGGCAAAKPVAEAAYLGLQLKCIDNATTRKEADECIQAVRLAWAKDSGAE